MPALTAMTARQTRNDALASYASYTVDTGQTVFEGSLVMVNNTGAARPASDTTGYACVGVATNGATAGQIVNVKFGHEELLTSGSTLAAVVGAACVATDDDTVTTAALGTNDIKVGEVVQVVSATRAWVKIRSAATI